MVKQTQKLLQPTKMVNLPDRSSALTFSRKGSMLSSLSLIRICYIAIKKKECINLTFILNNHFIHNNISSKLTEEIVTHSKLHLKQKLKYCCSSIRKNFLTS